MIKREIYNLKSQHNKPTRIFDAIIWDNADVSIEIPTKTGKELVPLEDILYQINAAKQAVTKQ